MSLSDDGNRAYIADISGNMLILDTSQIQARATNPQAREISRLTWGSASIPQNAIPFSENGHPYVLEFDEYTQGTGGSGDANAVGAGRIIDITDERQPRVVSDLRLQVDQPADHAAAKGDPGAASPVQGYAAHYCNIPSRVDPKIIACSFIASGLRVFDISDVTAPKEIAYFVAPTAASPETFLQPSNYAMSQPAFAPERREIWYSDGGSGFYALRVDKSVWPKAAPVCKVRKPFLVQVRVPSGAKVSSAKVGLKTARIVRRNGKYYALVNLKGIKRSTAHLVVRVKSAGGRTVTTKQTYRTCA